MRHQLNLLVCAVQFLTRLPTPALAGFEPAWITRSAKFFPLVGQLVGALAGLAFWLASQAWPPLLAAIVATAVAVLITGAFHEDGLADTADGLGGGKDRAGRLAIMKDSRIGTYGALALIAAFALRAGGLAEFRPDAAIALLLFVHGMARFIAVIAMATLPYAGDPDQAKVPQARVRTGEVAVAAVLAAWPALLLSPPLIVGAVIGSALLALPLAWKARKLIGGQTGDVLGGIEQASEVGLLLGALAAT